ncbi:MAG: hypothetical protein ACE5FL_04340 [Myxococcota bacterium]
MKPPAMDQDAVLWQSSQRVELAMWFRDFPVAVLPSWQLTQLRVTLA